MVDRVFPDTILAPSVAVVAANHNGRLSKEVQQRRERLVAVFQTGPLAFSALVRVVVVGEWATRIIPTIPGRSAVIIWDVGLADIDEREDRALQ